MAPARGDSGVASFSKVFGQMAVFYNNDIFAPCQNCVNERIGGCHSPGTKTASRVYSVLFAVFPKDSASLLLFSVLLKELDLEYFFDQLVLWSWVQDNTLILTRRTDVHKDRRCARRSTPCCLLFVTRVHERVRSAYA